jgi:hypothetical protein
VLGDLSVPVKLSALDRRVAIASASARGRLVLGAQADQRETMLEDVEKFISTL